MRLYLAGNFTVTDEVENEKKLKEVMGDNYHRLCTFFYPKAADVIVQNVKPDIPKKVQIDLEGLKTKKHKAIKNYKVGDQTNDKEINSNFQNKNKKVKKIRKIKRKNNKGYSL